MNHAHFFQKILVLSTILSVIFYFTNSALSSDTPLNESKVFSEPEIIEQYAAFENIDTPVLSNVWVAIATNIGTEFYSSNSSWANSWASIVYDEIISLEDLENNDPKVKQSIITSNMWIIEEYYGFLNNNFKNSLEGTNNREAFLDNAINQLAYRYKNSSNSIKTLESQKQFLQNTIANSNTKIEVIKQKLGTDYAAFDSDAVIVDMDDYLAEKNLVTTANMYLVFSEKFLEQYTFLNNYNKELLDTLILNRNAIVSDSFVVIPDTGDTTLRELDLLFEEPDFKSQTGAVIFEPDLDITPNSILNTPMNQKASEREGLNFQ